LVEGSAAALAAWAATGYPGLLRLRAHLAGPWDLAPIPADRFGRDLVDNETAAVAEIATAHPQEFLEVFGAQRWAADNLVLTGLGCIDDPRATERLARVIGSADQWVRMDAAIGLGRRVSPVASAALALLLVDVEYLVRYHALSSFELIGTATDIPALRAYDPRSPIEAEKAKRAIEAIRAREGPPVARTASGDRRD
jgi:hypothetical protein